MFTPDDVDTIILKAAIAHAEGDLPRAAALLAPLHPSAVDLGQLEHNSGASARPSHPSVKRDTSQA
jgi:hypothetical protein